MSKWLPLTFTLFFVAWLLSAFRGPRDKEDSMPLTEFGRLPAVQHGRHQPLDALARNSLLILRKKQTLNLEPWKSWYQGPKIIPAIEWLAEVMMDPATADTRPAFRIDNADLKTLLQVPMEAGEANLTDGKHYSWNQITPRLEAFRAEASRASQVKQEVRNAYERGVMDLYEAVGLYHSLQAALGPAGSGDLSVAMPEYRRKFEAGRTAFRSQMEGAPYDRAALDWAQYQINAPLVVPAPAEKQDYRRAVEEVGAEGSEPHYAIPAYAAMSAAWRAKDASAFSNAVVAYREKLGAEEHLAADLGKAKREQWFNHIEPFYRGMVISVCAFLLAIFVWANPKKFEWARRSACWLMMLVLVILTAGIIWRMTHEGRPPVTNLYSSALFIGWAAAALGLILERIRPLSIGVSVSSLIAFATLLVAHFLALDGDTMIMLRAVLDTNFWLATHVVTVTLGYAATYVSGVIGLIYVIRAVFTPHVTKELQKQFAGMAFAIVCFAALFSFIGTVLGGIWADQSWGRFWGWDPKENGALIIVLWNALILHARLGGLVRERGLLNLCIFGNICTSWSWFGTNMLGIGLHSYGFMDAAFYALMGFMGANAILIIIGCLPQYTWRSFSAPAPDSQQPQPA
jgi:ABC-type transport system involved in cytochrome c biogenesis permease subunit